MAEKRKISVTRKILMGFLSLIGIFCINAGVLIYSLNKNATVNEEIATVSQPSIVAMSELKLEMVNSKNYINVWYDVDMPEMPEKKALKKFMYNEYPAMREQILQYSEKWKDQNDRVALKEALTTYDTVVIKAKEIMQSLNTFEAYSDDLTKITLSLTKDEAIQMSNDCVDQLTVITSKLKEFNEKDQEEMTDSFNSLQVVNIILAIIVIVAGLIIAFFISRNITKPVKRLNATINKLSQGDLDDIEKVESNDEIGEMGDAVDSLVQGLRMTSNFADNIGNGNYDSEFSLLSEHDTLGKSLIEMRDNLKKVSIEDNQRNWANEGFAVFSDILRNNNNDIKNLGDEFVSQIAKYVKLNQVWLYVLQDNVRDEDPYLDLVSCYAFNRKKFLNKKILKGEGLAGQCWQEGESIYMTDIPDSYVEIASGLGEANPRNVLIVPLMINENISGVMEVASFEVLESYQVEFIKKVCESLASTLITVRVNEKTKVLLDESVERAEEMRAQEEEMRQNMEELMATQEEAERQKQDMEERLSAARNEAERCAQKLKDNGIDIE